MNFRNSNPATAFASKHAVMFDQPFGDVGLAHGSSYNTTTMPRRDQIHCAGCGNVGDDRPGFLSQTNISGDGERHLFREWLAKVADDSQALAIGVMGETDGGAASLNNRT